MFGGMFKGMIGGAGRSAIGSAERGIISSSTLQTMQSGLFQGITFAGKELIHLTTSSIGMIVSLGGGLVMFLLTQKPNAAIVK